MHIYKLASRSDSENKVQNEKCQMIVVQNSVEMFPLPAAATVEYRRKSTAPDRRSRGRKVWGDVRLWL